MDGWIDEWEIIIQLKTLGRVLVLVGKTVRNGFLWKPFAGKMSRRNEKKEIADIGFVRSGAKVGRVPSCSLSLSLCRTKFSE